MALCLDQIFLASLSKYFQLFIRTEGSVDIYLVKGGRKKSGNWFHFSRYQITPSDPRKSCRLGILSPESIPDILHLFFIQASKPYYDLLQAIMGYFMMGCLNR